MFSKRVLLIGPLFFLAFIIFFSLTIHAANSSDFGVECLYDSIVVNIEPNYTASIDYRLQYKYNTSINNLYSTIKIPENKYLSNEHIDIMTVLPDGRKVALSDNDIQVTSDFGPQYYPDSKTKIVSIPYTLPGAIATIHYDMKCKSLLYLPQFFRQQDIPVKNSYLKISSEIPYRYSADSSEFLINNGSSACLFWAAEIMPMRQEINMPSTGYYRIVIRPDTFIYEKEKYSLSSWDDVSAFYNNISQTNVGEDNQVRNLALDLCRDRTSFEDTLQTLFNYVQSNIRYISADIGRGDFRPLPPNIILAKKYGDCKDQASLLISLCRSVGIKAYSALLTTRDKPDLIYELPWPGYFNHVIAYIENGNQNIFLDTSQPTCCFDRLPFQSRDRRALVCRDDSLSSFAATAQQDESNLIEINMVYLINQNGEVHCDVKLTLFDDAAYAYYAASPDLILGNIFKDFVDVSPANQFRRSFKIEQMLPNLIIVSGNFFDRLLASPKDNSLLLKLTSPFMNHLQKQFPLVNRLTAYEFDFPYRLKENIILKLPAGYTAKPDSLGYDFNEPKLQFHRSLLCGDHTCNIYSFFQLGRYAIQPEQHNRFSGFFKNVMQSAPNILEIIGESNGNKNKAP